MPHYKLALLGFGNVGQALARLLLQKQDAIRSQYEITFSVTGIATGRHGAAIDLEGIDLERALQVVQQGDPINSLSTSPPPESAADFIRRCSADVLFENTPVNYETGQPAIDHLELALNLGMHAITANKGPVVHAYRRLTDLANAHGRKFFFESTVMDGAPIFSLFRGALPAAELQVPARCAQLHHQPDPHPHGGWRQLRPGSGIRSGDRHRRDRSERGYRRLGCRHQSVCAGYGADGHPPQTGTGAAPGHPQHHPG